MNLITKGNIDYAKIIQSKEEIQKKIDELTKDITKIEEAIQKLQITEKEQKISIENPRKLTEEEFEELLKKINLPDDKKSIYKNIFTSLKIETYETSYPNNYKKGLNIINNLIEEVNRVIEENNKLIENQLEELKKQTEELQYKKIIQSFLSQILKYMNLDYLSNDIANEINNFIINTKLLEEADKAILSSIIYKNIITNFNNKKIKELNKEKTAEELDKQKIKIFNEDLRSDIKSNEPETKELQEKTQTVTISAEIEECIEKYKEEYQKIDKNILFSLSEIEEYIADEDADEDCLHYIISTCIIEIYNEEKTSTEREAYIKCFKNALQQLKYSEYRRKLEQINTNIFAYIKNLYSFQGDEQIKSALFIIIAEEMQPYNEEINKLLESQKIITEESYNKMMQKYENIMSKVNKILNKSRIGENKQTIKGFIIAEKAEDEVCVIRDFIKETFVDETARNKAGNWQQIYSKLVNDLFSKAVPEALDQDSSKSNFREKIDDFVFFDEARQFPTGMHRYRPSRNSVVRFVEKKIILKPNTEIFKQVTNLILENLPNVKIDENEEFTIFINFANGLKSTEKDLYKEAIKRLRNSSLMKMFHKDGKYRKNKNESMGVQKTYLEDNDLEELEAYIKDTIESYRKLNNEYGFNIAFIDEATKKAKGRN